MELSTSWAQPLPLGEEERPREGLCPSLRSEKFSFCVVFFLMMKDCRCPEEFRFPARV